MLVDVPEHLVAAARTDVRDQLGVAGIALGGAAVGVVLGRHPTLGSGLRQRAGAAVGARGRSRGGRGCAGRVARDHDARDKRGDGGQTSGGGHYGGGGRVCHVGDFDEPSQFPAALFQPSTTRPLMAV